MGYYATCSGDITVRANTQEQLDAILSKITNVYYARIEETSDPEHGIYQIHVAEDDKFFQDEVNDMFTGITPYTIEGCVYYAGDDDAHWRVYFDEKAKQWISENAEIVFAGDLDDASDALLEAAVKKYFEKYPDKRGEFAWNYRHSGEEYAYANGFKRL